MPLGHGRVFSLRGGHQPGCMPRTHPRLPINSSSPKCSACVARHERIDLRTLLLSGRLPAWNWPSCRSPGADAGRPGRTKPWLGSISSCAPGTCAARRGRRRTLVTVLVEHTCRVRACPHSYRCARTRGTTIERRPRIRGLPRGSPSPRPQGHCLAPDTFNHVPASSSPHDRGAPLRWTLQTPGFR